MANIFQGITLLSSPPMAAAGLLGPDLVLNLSDVNQPHHHQGVHGGVQRTWIPGGHAQGERRGSRELQRHPHGSQELPGA